MSSPVHVLLVAFHAIAVVREQIVSQKAEVGVDESIARAGGVDSVVVVASICLREFRHHTSDSTGIAPEPNQSEAIVLSLLLYTFIFPVSHWRKLAYQKFVHRIWLSLAEPPEAQPTRTSLPVRFPIFSPSFTFFLSFWTIQTQLLFFLKQGRTAAMCGIFACHR